MSTSVDWLRFAPARVLGVRSLWGYSDHLHPPLLARYRPTRLCRVVCLSCWCCRCRRPWAVAMCGPSANICTSAASTCRWVVLVRASAYGVRCVRVTRDFRVSGICRHASFVRTPVCFSCTLTLAGCIQNPTSAQYSLFQRLFNVRSSTLPLTLSLIDSFALAPRFRINV